MLRIVAVNVKGSVKWLVYVCSRARLLLTLNLLYTYRH